MGDNIRSVTYLVYIIFWESLCWLGVGYAVFILDYSGWWILLAMLMSMASYKPRDWVFNCSEDESSSDA